MTLPSSLNRFLEKYPDLSSIEVLLTDSNGIIRGKHYPGDELNSLFNKGINFPISTLFLSSLGHDTAVINQEPLIGDPDCTYRVIAETLKIVPWKNKPTAQIMVQPARDDCTSHPYGTRTQLEQVLQLFKQNNWQPVIALEAEFFLFHGNEMPPRPLTGQDEQQKAVTGVPLTGPHVYNLERTEEVEIILDDIKSAARGQNIPLKSIVCEYGQGQFEINLDHSTDCLKACDDAMALKRLIRAIAHKHGLIASYMAKPVNGDVGSGMHIHMSILDDNGENIFGDTATGDVSLEHAVGGLLDMMPDTMALICPFENSFKRHRDSLADITPMNWGIDHRWVAIRIPQSGQKDKRLEHRIAGADVNPYLLAATVLAGAYHGLTNKMTPPPPVAKGQAIQHAPHVPVRWGDSLALLKNSTKVKNYFDPAFLEMYIRQKTDEEFSFHTAVSSEDLKRYFLVI